MFESHLLLVTTLFPLVGVIILFFIPDSNRKLISRVALYTSLITFLISLLLWLGFDESTAKFQFLYTYTWIPFININYTVGIDGISLFFIILTTFLTPICLLVG